MASGYGTNGGIPRCYTYWQTFAKCYAKSDEPGECRLLADDYLECLHHTKEIARAKQVQQELYKKVMHEVREGRKASEMLSDGVIVGVGLISGNGNEDKEKKK